MEKKVTSHVTKGLILALILIVFSLTVYLLELYTEQWIQYIGFVVLFAGILWSVIIFGKQNDYDKSFGSLFSHGFKMAALVAVLMIGYTVLSNFIFPDVKDKIIEMSREQALKNPNANESDVEKGMEFFSKYFTLFIVIGIIFWYLIIGAIASLIGAAVTKKNPSSNMPQTL